MHPLLSLLSLLTLAAIGFLSPQSAEIENSQSSAEIVIGAFEKDLYAQGESATFSVQVRNPGTTALNGLWLNVDIADPSLVNVREGWWQNLSSLAPGQTLTTDYNLV